MQINKHDALRAILKQATTEQPGRDFTAQVMNEITSEARDQVSEQGKMTSLLVNAGIDEVSTGFTHKVLREVKRHADGTALVDIKPIITKRVWLGLATLVLLLLVVSNFVTQGTHSAVPILKPWMVRINSLISMPDYFSSMYFIVPCSLCTLLVIDYALRTLSQRTQRK